MNLAVIAGLHRRMRALPSRLLAWLPECISPDCPQRHKWQKWRTPSLVSVEGQPYCITSCLHHALEKQFLQSRPSMEAGRPSHRLPLGLLLVARGWLNPEQLQAGLALQRHRGGRLGECLAALEFVAEKQITATLAVQWSCPVLSLRAPVESRLLSLLPIRVLKRNRILPVHYAEAKRLLSLAFTDGVNYALLNNIAQMLACETDACLIQQSEFDREIARIHERDTTSEIVFEHVADPAEQARITVSYAVRLQVQHIRVRTCGSTVWARLEAPRHRTDIIFDPAAN